MEKQEILKKTLDLAELAEAQQEWIEALPIEIEVFVLEIDKMWDKAKRFCIYNGMTIPNLKWQANVLTDIIQRQQKIIDAIPDDIELPVMPGYDRDWAESLLDLKKKGPKFDESDSLGMR